MVSRKVYDQRKAAGLCVRCGGSLEESTTTRCSSCKKSKQSASETKSVQAASPPDYSKDRVIGYYGGCCSSCGESNLELLDIVTASPELLDSRSQSELRKHICDTLYARSLIDPNFTPHCVRCYRKRSLQHAIDSIG